MKFILEMGRQLLGSFIGVVSIFVILGTLFIGGKLCVSVKDTLSCSRQ